MIIDLILFCFLFSMLLFITIGAMQIASDMRHGGSVLKRTVIETIAVCSLPIFGGLIGTVLILMGF